MNPAALDAYLAPASTPERYLRSLISEHAAPVIFDIGACEGEDSIRYARAFPRARIFAFEPLPENQALICANLSKHGVSNVELVPIAVSDHAGEAQFHISAGEPADKFAGENWNYGNKSSSLLPPASTEPLFGWIHFPRTIRVPCDTLDAFCARREIRTVDFVHMDVQGAEWLVLQGGRHMLPCIHALWLEVAEQELYAGQKLRRSLEALLRAAGFRMAKQEMRGVEGDELHVNPRFWRERRYWMRHCLRREWARARRRLRRIGRFALNS